MTISLNENGTILSLDSKPILKAANAIGEFILKELLKLSDPQLVKTIEVLPISYLEKQFVFLNSKNKYVLFDLSNGTYGLELVNKYLLLVNLDPSDDEMVVAQQTSGGVLTTDSGIPISTEENNLIDIPKECDLKQTQMVDKLDELKASESLKENT